MKYCENACNYKTWCMQNELCQPCKTDTHRSWMHAFMFTYMCKCTYVHRDSSVHGRWLGMPLIFTVQLYVHVTCVDRYLTSWSAYQVTVVAMGLSKATGTSSSVYLRLPWSASTETVYCTCTVLVSLTECKGLQSIFN